MSASRFSSGMEGVGRGLERARENGGERRAQGNGVVMGMEGQCRAEGGRGMKTTAETVTRRSAAGPSRHAANRVGADGEQLRRRVGVEAKLAGVLQKEDGMKTRAEPGAGPEMTKVKK
ncbi:hypothetical protein Q5P01_016542 [Channa striata]|uniref:Uncharacterized protein n=2 Tax=Channa striata TaxID=64152 RepID=A0AA88LFZ3_CHASR|nr:hypothetical protein Q5P01_000066 [Channa striata]KAK2836058.1 hypothetical protein Q5P01_016542 [Channa striata]